MIEQKKGRFELDLAQDEINELEEEDTTTTTDQKPKLRGARVPYNYVAGDAELYTGLQTTSRRVGILTFPFRSTGISNVNDYGSALVPANVRYAGSYTWRGPVTKADLEASTTGRSSQEKVFVTPGIPDVLLNRSLVGKVMSDKDCGYIDYVSDNKDVSFLPNVSPFEPIFRSLSSHSVLDKLDLIVDFNTLWRIVEFLLNPSETNALERIDAELVGNTFILHRWYPNVFIGAGEPHRGFVQSYTSRITSRAGTGTGTGIQEERWAGGTTQLVRYDLGGLGMLVRCPISARVVEGTAADIKLKSECKSDIKTPLDQPESESKAVPNPKLDQDQDHASVSGVFPNAPAPLPTPIQVKHIININPNSNQRSTSTHSNLTQPFPPIGETGINRSQNIHIKVHSITQVTEKVEVYAKLLLTQTSQVHFAPHHRGDFDTLALTDPPPSITPIESDRMSGGREIVEGVLDKAVDLWIRMISITRAELGPNRNLNPLSGTAAGEDIGISRGGGDTSGRMISFVFTEDGRVGVWKCERNKHRARLSQEAEGILINAAPSDLHTRSHAKAIQGYISARQPTTTGDWAMIQDSVGRSVQRWGPAHESFRGL